MIETLIRGGTLIDGTGAPGRPADVAIVGDRIVEVAERITSHARQVIDADGAIVTPGFVDIHTHYDGQLSWDDALEPSASHGVTTVVAGNCGVGFAPVRPSEREMLIALMEGVEDIPGTALHEGISWEWESYPEYLDAIARRRYSIDVATMVPHGALRVYAMGARGVANEPASSDDMACMAALMDEALAAGARGFSTSRVLEHQSMSGDVVPGTFASVEELLAIAAPMTRRRAGMLQMVPLGLVGGISGQGIGAAGDEARLAEARIAVELARKTGRPLTYSLVDDAGSPGLWRRVTSLFADANAQGASLYPQVSSRGVGTLTGFTGSHLFQRRPTYLTLADLPEADLLRALATSEIRAAILAEADVPTGSTIGVHNRHLMFARLFDNLYPLDEAIGFEPSARQSIRALADAAGIDPQAYLYDYMLRDGGTRFAVMYAANYNGASYDAVREMILDTTTVLGLSDAGAHVSVLCDASNPTFQLAFWGRDRSRGETLPLELLVHKQTAATARAAGFGDRGIVAAGKRADINIIDHGRLALGTPRMVRDLPCAGARILQGAHGYRATMVGGTITRRDDHDTGERPGRLVREWINAA